MKKKVLSVLMAAVLCVGMLPSGVLADTLDETTAPLSEVVEIEESGDSGSLEIVGDGTSAEGDAEAGLYEEPDESGYDDEIEAGTEDSAQTDYGEGSDQEGSDTAGDGYYEEGIIPEETDLDASGAADGAETDDAELEEDGESEENEEDLEDEEDEEDEDGIMLLAVTGAAGISSFSVSAQVDGTDPFDGNDSAGNDSSASNNIIRTFDYVNYTLSYTTALSDAGVSVTSGNIYVELTLPCGPDVASFNMSTLNWMENPVLTYYLPGGGTTTEYTNGMEVEKQVITGYRTLSNTGDTTAIPGTGTLTVGIYIGAAKNGQTLQPTFTAWMDDNSDEDKVTAENVNTLTISAAQKYNIAFRQSSEMNISGTYDISTGNSNASKDTVSGNTSLRGRMEGYGITVMMQNDSVDKGLKGLEFPDGDTDTITFDLTLTEQATNSSGNDLTNTAGYTPLIWDYDANLRKTAANGGSVGQWGRTWVYTNSANMDCAYQAAPFNKLGCHTYSTVYDSCYDGGNWYMEQDSTNPNVYHVTITGYTFDYENYNFPSTYNTWYARTEPGTTYTARQACFSSGTIQMVLQFPSGVSDAPTHIYYKMVANNFKVNDTGYSVSTTYTNTYELVPEGSIQPGANFTDDSGTNRAATGHLLGTAYNSGDSYSFIGNNVRLWGNINTSTDETIRTNATLLKFDADAFEVNWNDSYTKNGRYAHGSGEGKVNSFTYYFAGRSGNWESDEVMSNTLINSTDLTYYSSLDALEAAGLTCVGVLYIADVENVNNSSQSQCAIGLTVKDDADLVGNVYIACNDAWASYSTIEELEARYGALVTDGGKINSTWASEGYDLYRAYCNPTTYATMGKSSSTDESYKKTTYDDNGNITGGHDVAYYGGTSLLICGEKSTVEISTDQSTYDLDSGQRTATVTVQPTVAVEGSYSSEGNTTTTTVTISVTLDKNITYEAGSAYWGDQAVTPVITTNADGTTVLTFTLENVTVGETLDALTFDCTIGHAGTSDDIGNGTTVSLEATIQSTNDHRAKLESYGNVYDTSFSVVRLSSTSLAKSVDNRMIELDGSFAWTLSYYNGASEGVTGTELADVLPGNNDELDSSFSGTYSISKIELDFSEAPNSYTDDHTSLDFYVSTDYTGTGKDLATGAEPTGWEDLMHEGTEYVTDDSLTDVITFKVPAAYQNMNALYCDLGELEAGETVSIRLYVDTADNEPGDTYNNVFYEYAAGQTTPVQSNQVTTQVVQRNISGRTWIDANGNGLQDNGEAPLTNVTVTLYQGDTAIQAVDVYGNTVAPVITGPNGEYSFENLPAGTYRIEFSDVDGNIYKVTEANVGTNDQIDSDAKEVSNESGNLIADIANVSLPEIEDMDRYLYYDDYNDAGYAYVTGSLTITKSVVADQEQKDSDTSYTVNITSSDKEWGDMVLSAADRDGETVSLTPVYGDDGTTQIGVSFSITDGDEIAVSGLHVGDYTVSETSGSGFTTTYVATTSDGTAGESTSNAPTVTVVEDSEVEAKAPQVAITNDYPVTVNIPVTKNYIGTTNWPTEGFTFTLTAVTTEAPMPSNTSITAAGSDTVSFGDMTYTADGTYYYKVAETEGDAGGVTYDSTIYYVQVTVSTGGSVKTFTVKYIASEEEVEDPDTLSWDSAETVTDSGLTFTNAYRAEGSITLSATKDYTGAELTEGLFSFTVTETTAGVDEEDRYTGAGTNDADGSIIFTPDIAYTLEDVGTHTYVVAETPGSAGGVTYASNTFTVTVDVSDNNDGTLSTAVKVDGSDRSAGSDGSYNVGTFENSYEAEGSVTLTATKTISGMDSTVKTFNFALYNSNENFTYNISNIRATKSTTDTLTEGEPQTVTFPSITYTEAGTYYFVIIESSQGLEGDGWTYDGTEYHVTVVMEDNGEGSLIPTVTYEYVDENGDTQTAESADFTNTYKAALTSVQFAGTKYLSNSNGTDKVFAFELYETEDDNFDTTGVTPEEVKTSGSIDAGGQGFEFGEITYEEAGTHYYVIKEQELDRDDGWTISETVYYITVEVTDNLAGQLVADVSYVTEIGSDPTDAVVNDTAVTGNEDDVYGGFDFTNAYAATGSVALTAVKSLVGRPTSDTTFTFALYNSDASFAEGSQIETQSTEDTIEASQQVNFTELEYQYDSSNTYPMEYYYIIRETTTDGSGWTSDTGEYHVTVTVTDDGTGTLTTSPSYVYVAAGGTTSSADNATFTNTYAATGELNLSGTKTFEGGTITDGQFNYTVTEGETQVATGAAAADGTITFTQIDYTYSDVGEHTYTITEDAGSDSSVQYDEKAFTVVVTVTDNETGNLAVSYTVDGEESGSIDFTNYQKGSLTITKTFTGLDDDQIASLTDFTITVANSSGDTVATLTFSNADKDSSYTWTVSDLVADIYTVTETGYRLDGYEVIAKSGTVEVTNGDDVSVNDELAWGGKDTVAFTNDYTEVGSLNISKHVVEDENSNVHHLDVEYTVVITSASDGEVDFQWVTVTDSAGGTIDFTTDPEEKTITFTIKNNQILTVNGLPAGKYTVAETVPGNADFFEPVYKVGETETEGAPAVEVAAGDENIVSVEIENEYPIGTYIQVKKNYNNTVYPQDPDAFSFAIEPLSFDAEASDVTLTTEEMPMPTNESVTITDGNAVSFGPMEFDHLGTYYYKITEKNGGLNYIDYDSSVYYVKIVVDYLENENDTYYVETAEESYCQCEDETEDYKELDYTAVDTVVTAEFTNTYSAEGGVALTATKEYTGAKLEDGLFSFTITETTTGVDEEELYTGTGTNDAEGNITFTPAIEYTYADVGTHTYVISETNDQNGGVTYDPGTVTVTIVVSDNTDGTLAVTVTADGEKIESGEDDGAYNVGTFTNSYQATGSVTFGGEKTISGKEIEENQQFVFSLYTTDSDFTVAEDAEAVDTQMLIGAGSFTFDTIDYDSDATNGAGTYYYVVRETSIDENGWTMDGTEYHITAVVNDAGDGTFTLEVTCVDAEDETVTLECSGANGVYSFTGLDFSNSYKAAETSVQFTGTKYLTNSASDNDSTNKVFTFELYDADSSFTVSGDAAQTRATTGAGSITFDTITYEEVGTHYYVIQEQTLDKAEGWTIDPKVYNITVEVTDDGFGQLVATVTVNGSAASGTDGVYGGFDFTNAYAAEGEVTLGVIKSISGVPETEETFEFTLYNSDEDFSTGRKIEEIETDGTIKSSTQVEFTSISYTEAGSYYYLIKETGRAPSGWTLDEKEYHVTVTVTDNGDGTLTTSASYTYLDEDEEAQTENSAAFTNTYAATGELSLTGQKTLAGGKLEENGFEFTMTDGTGASVGDVTMDAKGNITFPTLTYDETDIGGEYTYVITEVDANDPGVVYDDTTFTVVVSVADNKDGTLKVTYKVNGEESGDIAFTNYQKGSLTITKTFTGLSEEQIAGLTDFTITVTNSSGYAAAVLTLDDADEDSSYTWTVINLPADTYTVNESGYSLDGYEVIANSVEMEVTDGSDVSVSDTLDWGGSDTVEFTNDYTEVGTITISKYVVAEDDIQEAHENTEYTVVLTAGDRNVDFQWVSVTSDSGREITLTIDKKTITFKIMECETVTISGLPAGRYTLEETGSDAELGEHVTPIYRIGDVEDENAPAVTVASGSENVVEVEIDNEYPIGTYIKVQKDYNREDFPEEGFTFRIEALSCDPEAEDVTIGAKDMPMPDNETVTLTESGETGYFSNIVYEHLGTYYYKITETPGKDDHIIYDSSVHYIKVVVASTEGTHVETTDEYEAWAEAETEDYKYLDYAEAGIVVADFDNTALEELTIEKEVSGDAGDITEYEFEIKLTNRDGTPFEGTVTRTTGSSSGASGNRLAAFFTGRINAFAGENEEDDSTLTFVEGKATITLTAGEKVTLMIPSGVNCTITELTTGADTTTVYRNGEVIVQAKGKESKATADAGTIEDSTQIKFVNSYRNYFPIDEEIVPDDTDRNTWVKEEAVNEYNAIEIEMSTLLPQITGYDLENGAFTMTFHEMLDSNLVLDELDSDFSVYIAGNKIDHQYYTITLASEVSPAKIQTFADSGTIEDGCTFHVDVDLTALYRDGVITEEHLQGDTEIIIFFYADLEGTGLNGSYTSTVWYEIYDGDEWQFTSNVDVVDVYTYEIDLIKYDVSTFDGTDYDSSALAGATFGVFYDADGTDPVSRSGEPYTVTSGDDGRVIFYGLADGTYYVRETEAPTGYALSDEVLEIILDASLIDSGHAYKGTFADHPLQTEISGSKIWDDSDDQDGRRPESITIRLWADDTEIDSRTVTEADGWAWSFTDLNLYANGQEIAYTVTEDAVSDYTTDYDADNHTITNSYTPEETSLTVVKVWADEDDRDGLRPDEITVTLVKNGDATDETLILSKENGWIGTFGGLDEYENGEKIEYTVEETNIPEGYEAAISGDATTGYTILNTHETENGTGSGPKNNPDTGNPDNGNPGSGNPDSGNPDSGNPTGGSPTTGGKTGDVDLAYLWILLMIAAAAAVVAGVTWRTRPRVHK